MKYLFLTTLLVAGAIFSGQAYTANDISQTISSDGSYADTAKAVAYVQGKAQDGWVLTVGTPGGSYTWTNQLSLILNNVFTMQGADTNNRPTIVFNTTANSGIYLGLGSQLVTVRDFIFDTGTSRPKNNLVGIDGGGVCFRVANCKFVSTSLATFDIQVGSINAIHTAGPFGLVDHCQFFLPAGVVYNYLNVRANGNIDNYGWTQPMSWGTTNAVVVEDCDFSQPLGAPLSGLVEADGAARLTIRYCNITNIPESTHGIASGAGESTLQVECYENRWVWNDAGNTAAYCFWQRGGTAVIWSNTIATTSFWNLGNVFRFTVECASTNNWSAEHCPRQLFYPADYPGPQQVGQGVVNGVQGSVPIYIWSNTVPATPQGTFGLGGLDGPTGGDLPFIQQGRDIFTNSVMPGYTALVYPHPLVSSAPNTVGGNIGTVTGTGAVIPPADLQAHPPTTH